MKKTAFKKLKSQGLIENYNYFRKNLLPKSSKKIFVWDETINEGEKIPGIVLSYTEKVRIAQMMDNIGVAIINLGFPGFSEEEKKTIARLSNENFSTARLAASARITRNDIDACLRCSVQEILISAPFNELQLRYVLKKTKTEVLESVVDSIEYAKAHGFTVNFALEDASRTPISEILQIFEVAVNAGGDRLVFEDTIGFLKPLSVHYIISRVRKGLLEVVKKKVQFSIKCCNDFGLATANTLAAIEEGITYPQTSIAGFGERTGIAPMEEVVVAVELLCKADTGIDAKKLYRLSQLVEKAFVSPIPFHKPIVGEDAFSHTSNKQIHGMLSHPLSYEPFPPKLIGRETISYIGISIGKQAVRDLLWLAGVKANPKQVDEIFMRLKRSKENVDKGHMLITFYQIKKLLKELRKGLTDESFWEIVKQVMKQ